MFGCRVQRPWERGVRVAGQQAEPVGLVNTKGGAVPPPGTLSGAGASGREPASLTLNVRWPALCAAQRGAISGRELGGSKKEPFVRPAGGRRCSCGSQPAPLASAERAACAGAQGPRRSPRTAARGRPQPRSWSARGARLPTSPQPPSPMGSAQMAPTPPGTPADAWTARGLCGLGELDGF